MTITQRTLKKLFAVSGNKCYFSRCNHQIYNTEHDTITGIISHIKARSPGGSRYDESQTEEERDDFDNLILMCSIHHKVIDDDPDSYTVERLQAIKQEHEAQNSSPEEPDDLTINNFIINYMTEPISTEQPENRGVEIQLYFNKFSHFLYRLLKGELQATFIKNLVYELNQSSEKEYFILQFVQTGRGFNSKIDILNGEYRIAIQSSLEGTYINMWNGIERVNNKDFSNIQSILQSLQNHVQINFGYKIVIPNSLPNCNINIEIQDKPLLFVIDNHGSRSEKLSRDIKFKIENIGKEKIVLTRYGFFANNTILLEESLERIEIQVNEFLNEKIDEDKVIVQMEMKSINQTIKIRFFIELEQRVLFYSNSFQLKS